MLPSTVDEGCRSANVRPAPSSSGRYTTPVVVTRSASALAASLADLTSSRRAAVLTDTHVLGLHGAQLFAALERTGFDLNVCAIERGQAMSDFFGQVNYVSGWLKRHRRSVDDLVLTVGGGAIAQLGGWIASRLGIGLPYFHLPTTLMAQVAAACGGPHEVHSALAPGVFMARHPPVGVIANVAFNVPLEQRRLLSGIAEYIKIAAISPRPYSAFIDEHLEALLSKDLNAAIALEPERAHWFGQTVGSAIRSVLSCTAIIHGDALALGMVAEAYVAETRALVDKNWIAAMIALLDRAGLPAHLDTSLDVRQPAATLTTQAVLERAGLEHQTDQIRAQLPLATGHSVEVDDLSLPELRVALGRVGVPAGALPATA